MARECHNGACIDWMMNGYPSNSVLYCPKMRFLQENHKFAQKSLAPYTNVPLGLTNTGSNHSYYVLTFSQLPGLPKSVEWEILMSASFARG